MTHITLQQLETFFWTVTLGSFAAAAEKLYTTQSTVSMRIRELERNLGVALFDRSQRKARLTSRGREVLDYASRILDLSTEMTHSLAAPERMAGTIRLGVAEVVSTTWLPRLIRSIAMQYPRVHLEIEEALTGDLMDGLHNGALELVLAPGTTSSQQTSSISLGRVEFAWMASPALGLGGRTLRPRDLAKWPIIGLKPQSFHYASIEDWFRRDHVQYRYLARCKSMAVAASMTIAELGVTYLPIRNYANEIESGALEVIHTTAQTQAVEFVAITSPEHYYSLAERLADLAREISDFDKPEHSPQDVVA
jgi:DNA-binding transcriptional LysR family regulator